jgi:hypothetical protein
LAGLNAHPNKMVLAGHHHRQLALRFLHRVVRSTPARFEGWLTTILTR